MRTDLNAGTELKIFAIFVKSESGKSSWSLLDSKTLLSGFGFDVPFVMLPMLPKLRNFRLRLVVVTESRVSGLNLVEPLGHFRFRWPLPVWSCRWYNLGFDLAVVGFVSGVVGLLGTVSIPNFSFLYSLTFHFHNNVINLLDFARSSSTTIVKKSELSDFPWI